MKRNQMEFTSSTSGRLIPALSVVRRSVLLLEAALGILTILQSVFLWFLILLHLHRGRSSILSASTLPSPKGKVGQRRKVDRWSGAEEEDAKRRRKLAESADMSISSAGKADGGSYRCERFMLHGTKSNALFCRSWLPAAGNMKAIMVIIHGLNEHSGRYTHFASQLTACNYGVYAMDWIGHGGSDGLHGYVPSLDWVVSDSEHLLTKIRLENPGVPCFLFGHSTGGAVVLKAALYSRIESLLEGIILTSPALRVKPAHAIVGTVAPLLSFLLPRFQFRGASESGLPVSRDPVAILEKYSDPLVYTGPIRIRTGHEILRISSYLMQNITLVTVPFMVLHGTADRVTDPFASMELYNSAASEQKDIKLYEGFLHDLLFEPERDEIGADIIDWMEKRLRQRSERS